MAPTRNFILMRFGPPRNATGIRDDMGGVEFAAADDQSAIEYALDHMAEQLADCDYAAILSADGQTIWEMKGWSA
jgi:hypothetical protein